MIILVIFGLVYAGMAVGSLPRVRIDRAWIAAAGATVLIAYLTGRAPCFIQFSLCSIPIKVGGSFYDDRFRPAAAHGRCYANRQ